VIAILGPFSNPGILGLRNANPGIDPGRTSKEPVSKPSYLRTNFL